ncbi:MAG: single-stranded-DNA-specific exonuclease RecJ [Parvularcula sp.]|nr:single-stranded-DNA-specific exonuclease RecJ [Parvularcula sp.]
MSFDSPEPVILLGVHRSVTGRVWHKRPACRRETDLAVQQHGVDALLAEVLIGRGVPSAAMARHLSPSLRHDLPDPFVLKEMEQASARLADAVIGKQVIGIFGDYDVDGTSAASLLFRYLRDVGAQTVVHLPDRFTEGYGPSAEALRGLEERGADVVVTVDCGSNHADALAGLKSDVIVLDHHQMGARPDVFALVNPQRAGDTSGLGGLSAGGIAFMAVVALNRILRERGFFDKRPEPNLLHLLDLVALSLVCDVMPLRGVTRTLVAQGLRLIGDLENGHAGNPGLRALAAVAGLKGCAQASHLGFQLGPRINAAGRIGHAKTAFDLLTTDEPSRAMVIAEKLEALNRERRRIEEAVRQEAVAAAQAQFDEAAFAPIVVAGEGWHPGVVGIVAGRLKERFHRPAFCIAMENGRGTGSGRSLSGVDLGAAVTAARDAGLIEGGGGHAMAAGLTIRQDQLEPFRAFVAERLHGSVAAAAEEHPLVLDGIIGLGAVSGHTCSLLAPAGPFGQGNPEPRFALEDVVVRQSRIVAERHLSVTIEDRMGKTARGIAFGVVGEPLGDLLAAPNRQRLHLAGRISPDTWRGADAGQLEIDDASPAKILRHHEIKG